MICLLTIQQSNLMRKSKKINKSSVHRVPSRNYQVIIKNIIMKFDDFTELVEDINVGDCVTEFNQLSVHRLLKKLENYGNYFFKDKAIKYYLQEGNIWIKCPHRTSFLNEQDYMPYPDIKFEMKTDNTLINVVMKQEQGSNGEEPDEEIDQEGRCRRLKERKIKNVIEKVLQWRELYAGIDCGREADEKIPLERGADIVKISKKTLDDYLAQLKKGKKYGFNFNEHKNEKVGVLRQFIRKAEKRAK